MNLVDKLLARIGKNERKKRIVIIGDAMVDHWIHGRLEDCQDGCQKFVQELEEVRTLGGASNAQNCLSQWPIESDLFAQSGKYRVDKWRFLEAGGRIVFRWDAEVKYDITTRVDRDYLTCERRRALELVQFAGAVLLSDYDKGFLTIDFIQEVVGACMMRGIPCVADAKRQPSAYVGAILKSNMAYSIKWCHLGAVCTAGEQPPLAGDSWLKLDLPKVPCVNHVGAGDCFAAHLAMALGYGFTLEEAATLAHSAGRVYVQYPHNRPPHPSEIEADLESAVVGLSVVD